MHLFRGRQDPVVIAIYEHGSFPSGNAIDRAGETRTDRLHAASERGRIVGFDDQVRVIALQGVMHEPKARTLAAAPEGTLDLADDPRVP